MSLINEVICCFDCLGYDSCHALPLCYSESQFNIDGISDSNSTSIHSCHFAFSFDNFCWARNHLVMCIKRFADLNSNMTMRNSSCQQFRSLLIRALLFLAKQHITTRYIYKIPISCLTGHVVPEKTIVSQATVQHSTLLAPVMGSGATSPGLLRRSPLLRSKNLHAVPVEYGVCTHGNIKEFKCLI